MLTKYLNIKFDREGSRAECTPAILAKSVAAIVLMDTKLLGTRILNQSALAPRINLPLAMVKKAWIILSDDYQLIDAKPGRGTTFVGSLSYERMQRLEKLIKNDANCAYPALLDKKLPQLVDPSFKVRLWRAMNTHVDLPVTQQQQRIIDGMLPALAKLTGSKLNCAIADNEVYYTDDYAKLITDCCMMFTPSKSTVVLLTPVSAETYHAIVSAKRKPLFLTQTALAAMMDELEMHCRNGLIMGMVVIGMMGPYLINDSDYKAAWKRLTGLRMIYNFEIMLDDRFAGMLQVPGFRDIIESIGSQVIFIYRISIHETLYDANVIAADADHIGRLAKRLAGKGELLAPAIAFALLRLVKQYLSRSMDLNGHPPLDAIITAARNKLLEPEIFIRQHISNQQGYLFYLEPENGRFPRDIYRKLKAANIHVIHPDTFMYGSKYTRGIIISVLSSQIVRQVERDIEKLISTLKNYIKK
ncbi:hypothetical protein SAMN06265348_12139 [Pedobacter westerhofensis]|uniref:DNA-binding transcriptional regulator, MocR family, contains an aminotransferase domain n=1 Tax=Pedobacter westerhofensis TaxID=425512 RepID=A0A521FUP8_9SPHI|nr:hypothetical protein [Pedobacter westerhofensis]SMO99271.1 hypothetical protein SAMN06265348_12139 [Pedobacter westerhofensis]